MIMMELTTCTALALSIPIIAVTGLAIVGAIRLLRKIQGPVLRSERITVKYLTAKAEVEEETEEIEGVIRLAKRQIRKVQPHHVGMAVAICVAALITAGASQTEFKDCGEEDSVARAIKKYAPEKAVELVAITPCNCD